MKHDENHTSDLSLEPLGPGDLIDRAVRFYRKYFRTFVLIAAPPVVIGTFISVLWTILGRQLFTLGPDEMSFENTLYYLFLWFGTIVIWFAETIATLVIMGGASRNFVRHLLFGEPITFTQTYNNAWERFGGLLFASTLIAFVLGLLGTVIFYFGLMIAFLLIAVVIAVFESVPVFAFVLSLVIGLGVTLGTVWLFFLAASRLAYVPQVMLVEGQSVFASISRSTSLAGGTASRLAALFFFSTVAAYSALLLLFVPLAWFASNNGVELMPFGAEVVPAWYEIAYNVIWQISFILLSPVWMIGLCLLYIDQRVRTEGYDIELMAAARLGEIPSVPSTYVNPLHPALANNVAAPNAQSSVRDRSNLTTLGLR